MKKNFGIFVFVFFQLSLSAQLEKTIHQTFELNQPTSISLEIKGDYELVSWSGDHILTETNIELYDATEGILQHYLKAGRYEVLADTSVATQFKLYSKDQERRVLRTKRGECFEVVKMKIFVPETFDTSNPTLLVRKEPLTESKNN
ncbi:MAG TPA: hypothetical protein PKC40_09750 [Saprospiraceae bacterium]|nr:hypothetical protein [Saprospiraceae bacterium]